MNGIFLHSVDIVSSEMLFPNIVHLKWVHFDHYFVLYTKLTNFSFFLLLRQLPIDPWYYCFHKEKFRCLPSPPAMSTLAICKTKKPISREILICFFFLFSSESSRCNHLATQQKSRHFFPEHSKLMLPMVYWRRFIEIFCNYRVQWYVRAARNCRRKWNGKRLTFKRMEAQHFEDNSVRSHPVRPFSCTSAIHIVIQRINDI